MIKQSNNTGANIDDWETPNYIKDYIKKTYGDYFDPCPIRSSFNGLIIDWENINYINPPYSRKLKEEFIIKALEESKKGKLCIMLLPANTDTRIFHEIIVPNAVISLISKRIMFIGYDTKGNFVSNKTGTSGSMLCVFGSTEKPIIKTLIIKNGKKENK
jgi:hypothetical protein